MRGIITRGFAAVCITSAAAGGGYLIAAQATAGAQSVVENSSGSSSTSPCRDPGGDSALGTAKRQAVEQFASKIGVSLRRLGPADVAMKREGIGGAEPRAAGILAHELGLDPAVVRPALARLMAKFPFNQTTGAAASAAKRCARVNAEVSACEYSPPGAKGSLAGTRPSAPDTNDPKAVAIRGLARTLGVTMGQLTQAFGVSAAHGVRTLDDPRMPSALAQTLSLDPARVQHAIAGMMANPPFAGAGTGTGPSAKTARK